MSGHFFCDTCEEVVNIRHCGLEVERCPVCHKLTARWVKHLPARNGGKLIDAPLAAKLFSTMKGAVKA